MRRPRPSGRRRPNSEVQCGQRVALRGMVGQAEGTLLGGGCGRRRHLFPFHAIEALDHQEHGKGDDEES